MGPSDHGQKLLDFVLNKMRMSHVYQPVMLTTLLDCRGSATAREVANALLAHDETQLDYYRSITGNMVGRVLKNHGLIRSQGRGWSRKWELVGFDKLTEGDIEAIRAACKEKLHSYVEKRGKRIWEHRTGGKGYVPGSLRYEVLKRAQFHCELCGIPADEKALEVDHIVPRKKLGTDDISNLQALCYTCNAQKRDHDDTDFRAVRDAYKAGDSDCIFCSGIDDRVFAENRLAVAIRDGYPVSELHTLVIPRRHVPSFMDLGGAEIRACHDLVKQVSDEIQNEDQTVTGFNVGVNVGEDAGQTVFHCHIHVIPRRRGDVEDPVGGVRNLMPGRGRYR
jgi:diadenosine tetraphosphate (Ap4A) HIT family hydrolase/5-methylcytosine-specific restriction endonuclease McrA